VIGKVAERVSGLCVNWLSDAIDLTPTHTVYYWYRCCRIITITMATAAADKHFMQPQGTPQGFYRVINYQ